MRFTRLIAGFCIAATMMLGATPPPPATPSTAQASAVEKINWQAPPDLEASKVKPQKPKKKKGKGKWIAIGAVAAAAVVTVILVDKRLGNEGAGIFR